MRKSYASVPITRHIIFAGIIISQRKDKYIDKSQQHGLFTTKNSETLAENLRL